MMSDEDKEIYASASLAASESSQWDEYSFIYLFISDTHRVEINLWHDWMF
jgi:hypothetical protein